MEADQARLGAQAASLAGVHTNQDKSAESVESVEDDSTSAASSKSTTPAHGRSADVFPYGCVFLEILSVLVDAIIPGSDAEDFEYCKNVTKLQVRAEGQSKMLNPNNPVRIPFYLSIKMIGYKAFERLKLARLSTN